MTGRALQAAVQAIYFMDSSDYLSALWAVVRDLSPATADLLERDEQAAFDAVNSEDCVTGKCDVNEQARTRARKWLEGTARTAGTAGVTTDQESCMRVGYEHGYLAAADELEALQQEVAKLAGIKAAIEQVRKEALASTQESDDKGMAEWVRDRARGRAGGLIRAAALVEGAFNAGQ